MTAQIEAFHTALKGVPMSRDELASHLGITSRALRYYVAGERAIPRLVALAVIRYSEPSTCVCAAIPHRERGERCNFCRRKGTRK